MKIEEVDIANEEMQNLHDERLAALTAAGLLDLESRYWAKRAEVASRSLLKIADMERTNMVKGQISICFETSDEAKRAQKAREAEAKAKRASKIPDKKKPGITAV